MSNIHGGVVTATIQSVLDTIDKINNAWCDPKWKQDRGQTPGEWEYLKKWHEQAHDSIRGTLQVLCGNDFKANNVNLETPFFFPQNEYRLIMTSLNDIEEDAGYYHSYSLPSALVSPFSILLYHNLTP